LDFSFVSGPWGWRGPDPPETLAFCNDMLVALCTVRCKSGKYISLDTDIWSSSQPRSTTHTQPWGLSVRKIACCGGGVINLLIVNLYGK
jgi:hypothetical protein